MAEIPEKPSLPSLIVLGVGYVGRQLLAEAGHRQLAALGVRRTGGQGYLALDDPALPARLEKATAIVATAPPTGEGDPYLNCLRAPLKAAAAKGVPLLYLSSAGVYGDHGGAFVDEETPLLRGQRNAARQEAEARWLQLGAASLRLAGIYGPGRSAFERLQAPRIEAPGVRFCRVHVADIVTTIFAIIAKGWHGPLNVADDCPAPPRAVQEYACHLAGAPLPPLVPLVEASLSPLGRSFYTERRLLATGRLMRLLGHRLHYPDFKAGLHAIHKG